MNLRVGVIVLSAMIVNAGGALASHPAVPIPSPERQLQASRLAGTSSIPTGLRQSHANDFYVGGEYVGTDPDPRIRAELIREHLGRSSD